MLKNYVHKLLHVCPSVGTPELVDWFSWNLATPRLTKILRHISIFVKQGALYMTRCVCFRAPEWVVRDLSPLRGHILFPCFQGYPRNPHFVKLPSSRASTSRILHDDAITQSPQMSNTPPMEYLIQKFDITGTIRKCENSNSDARTKICIHLRI